MIESIELRLRLFLSKSKLSGGGGGRGGAFPLQQFGGGGGGGGIPCPGGTDVLCSSLLWPIMYKYQTDKYANITLVHFYLERGLIISF